MLVNDFQTIRTTLSLQEETLQAIFTSLGAPLFYDSGIEHFGFRYATPDHRNYCALKAARCVSGLSAAVELAERGYNQEIVVFMRTIVEFSSYIEFVLSGLEDGALKPKQAKFVSDYFAGFSPQFSGGFPGTAS